MFTRAFLKSNGLNDDQITAIMEEHTSVVDALKSQRDGYKADAEKLPALQQELDTLKSGEDYKAKYDKEHADFEAYKTDILKAAELEKVKAAYRKLLTEEKISEKRLDSILKLTDFSGMKLDKDGNLENAKDLRESIGKEWADFKVTTKVDEQKPPMPPTNDNGGASSGIRQMTAQWHEARYGKPQQKG